MVSFNPLDLPDAVSVWSLSNRDAGNLAAQRLQEYAGAVGRRAALGPVNALWARLRAGSPEANPGAATASARRILPSTARDRGCFQLQEHLT
jgi:hypothetical protein